MKGKEQLPFVTTLQQTIWFAGAAGASQTFPEQPRLPAPPAAAAMRFTQP